MIGGSGDLDPSTRTMMKGEGDFQSADVPEEGQTAPTQGAAGGVDRFGTSAPGPEVMARYGFTVEHVVATAKAVLASRVAS